MFGWFEYNMLTRRVGDAVKTPLGGRRPVCWGKMIIILWRVIYFSFFSSAAFKDMSLSLHDICVACYMVA